jgi:hypothetical protein
MKDLFNKIWIFLKSLYLYPFILLAMIQIYFHAKKMDIPFMRFLADENWMAEYFDMNTKKGYEISTGVWIFIYIVYILFK